MGAMTSLCAGEIGRRLCLFGRGPRGPIAERAARDQPRQKDRYKARRWNGRGGARAGTRAGFCVAARDENIYK